MSWIKRVRAIVHHHRLERDLDDELRLNIELKTRENIEAGMSAEEARLAALKAFGSVEHKKEECRDADRWRFIEDLWQDARYGLRQLHRNPGFTTIAVMTLALAIGANTAIFSVINAVMLRMLPVQDPERLVQVAFEGKHSAQSFVGESFSYPLFKELRQHNQVFADMSVFDFWDSFEAHLADPSSSASGEPVKGQLVSANFFSVLGVSAALGRTFAPDEDSAAAVHPVAVISYGLWTRGFARDPGVLGNKLVVEGTPLTIIGVAPQHFSGANPGQSCDLWVPVTMQPQVIPGGFLSLTDSTANWLSVMARLKPGVTAEQARAGLDVLYQQIQRQRDLSKWSEQDRRDFFTHRIVLLPAAHGTDYLRKEFEQPLFLLMGMVGLVLLIACANTANLLLARASVREREIVVRLALGAGRLRLVRQLLTESLLLALAGGAIGVFLAYWGSPVLVGLMSRRGAYQIALDVHPDLRVLAFTVLMAVITGVAAGLVPAVRATRTNRGPAFQAGSRNLTVTRAGRNLGRALVIAQVALSIVLVVGAGLLVRTLHNLETLNPGFTSQNVLLFRLDPTRAGYKEERLMQLYQQLQERIRQVAGVRSASYSYLTPISGAGWDNYTFVEGYTPGPGENMDVYINAVGPQFFETLRTPLLMGRSFGLEDRAGSTWVAVINQTMARRFFPDRSPIGKHFGRWNWNGRREYEIIGVVGDAKYLSLRENVPPTAYLYIPQLPQLLGGVTFEVSSAVPPISLVPQVRSLLQSVDSRLTASDVKTLAEQVDQSLYQEKLVSTLSSCFGALALGLACIGLYGVMSYAVARRTSEIGIRMALGAESRRILQMVLGEALMLVIFGIVIGVTAALAASRLIGSMLYGLNAADPAVILAAVAVMAVVTVLAGYVPARCASLVDPMVALRAE